MQVHSPGGPTAKGDYLWRPIDRVRCRKYPTVGDSPNGITQRIHKIFPIRNRENHFTVYGRAGRRDMGPFRFVK